jgi:hypothetical protein
MNTTGTSIQDLYRQQKNDQFEQHKMNNNQQTQYNMNNNIQQYNPNQPQQPQQMPQQMPQPPAFRPQTTNPEIEELIRDINNGLSVDNIDYKYDIDTKKNENYKEKIFKYIPVVTREPLLLVIIYYLMSQQFFKNYIGQYINRINQDSSGKVSNTGVIMYGILLATIFAVLKFILIP